MKFETNPQLILTKDEFETLNNALKLCRDMDEQTNEMIDNPCLMCPLQKDCLLTYEDCTYIQAHKALKKIIDIAIVK